MKIFWTCWLLVLSWQFSFAKEVYTLEQSINQAKKSNLNLDIARENLKKSYLDIQKAKEDKLPTLNLTFDYKQEHLKPTLNTFKNSLDLTWDLSVYEKHSDLAQILLSKAVQKDKDIIVASLVYHIKVGYFSLMSLKEKLSVLEKNSNLLIRQKKITQKLVASQIILKSSLLQEEDQINHIENQILQTKIQIQQQREELIHMIFVSHYQNIEFQKYEIDFKSLPKLPLLLNQILNQSPLIQRLRYEKKAIQKSIDKPWKDKLPIVSAGTSQYEEWPNSWSKYDFHIGVTFAILDNSKAHYNRQVNIIKYMKKSIEIDKQTKTILDAVTILYKKAQQSKKLYLGYKKTYEHQEKTFSLMKQEYQVGFGSVNDLLTIQKGMMNAAFNMNKTFFEYAILLSQIDFYKGSKQ